MASPPRAGSPPSGYLHGAGLNLSRKRPSMSTGGPGGIKRRKASMVSSVNSAHPLRQTSFPPPESTLESRASSFSPPVNEFIPGPGRGVGRRKRGGKRNATADTRSQIAASAAGTRIGNASLVNGAGHNTEEPEEDDDDDDGGGADTVLEGGTVADEAQMKLERENLRMLVDAFTPEQADQYAMWRRVRLNKATVRRLVNQTLSQSVPTSVITTVSGYTKLFIGELIERARDVQTEWLAASPLRPIDERLEPKSSMAGQEPLELDENGNKEKRPREKFEVQERDKGPLLPEHLREALRRYKAAREGSGTGFHGLSLNGNAKTASRLGGKRLFR